MDSNNPLILVTKEQYLQMYKELNITQKDLEKAVDVLEEWFKLQPHLPDILPERRCLKILLIVNKMSVEKAKIRLDMKCNFRNLAPEIFLYSDFLRNGLKDNFKIINWMALPKLTSDLSRVTVFRILGKPEDFNLLSFFRMNFIVGDYRVHNDCCISDTMILDYENLKAAHFTKINPVLIKKAELAYMKAYGIRLAGLYIINAPPFADKLVKLIKQTLTKKLSERIKVFGKVEELYKYVEKDILPVDYGGNERSMSVLADEWVKELTSDKWSKILTDEEKFKSDESKRPSPQTDSDLLGLQGSFRRLDVD